MTRPGIPFRINVRAQSGAMLLSALCWIGCGGQTETPVPQAQTTSAPQAAPSTSAAPADQPTPVASAIHKDPRTKWIGNVPYDVFFDRPLDVYRDSTPVGGAPAESEPMPESMPPETVASNSTDPDTATTPESTGSSETPAGGGPDWGALATIDVLNEEIKERRNRLTTNLQTVATYNGNTETIVTDGNILASIAAVIERHPGELNWKEKAGHVRTLAYDMYLSAGTSGRGPFENTKEPFEQLTTILDGGPADGEAEEAALSDVGDRAEIMKRIEESFSWLRADINTDSRLKEDKDRVIREASVLATLGTIIGDANYESATADDYKQFLQQFIDGCKGMVAAANAGNFAQYESARNMVDGSCNPCHQQYRSGESGF
jgi:hypothetical protein